MVNVVDSVKEVANTIEIVDAVRQNKKLCHHIRGRMDCPCATYAVKTWWCWCEEGPHRLIYHVGVIVRVQCLYSYWRGKLFVSHSAISIPPRLTAAWGVFSASPLAREIYLNQKWGVLFCTKNRNQLVCYLIYLKFWLVKYNLVVNFSMHKWISLLWRWLCRWGAYVCCCDVQVQR